MLLKTPLMIRLSQWDEYLEGISKKARYDANHLPDYLYDLVPFSRGEVREWMDLWTRQTVFGRHPNWGRYDIKYFQRQDDSGWLRVFRTEYGLQMASVYGDYVYSYPPLYDKAEHPEVARFLWFRLIHHCSGKYRYLDFGGGSQNTWKGLLENPPHTYKLRYIPKRDRNPGNANSWRVQVCPCGYRELTVARKTCTGCGRAP